MENSMPAGGFKNNVKFGEASQERVTREKASEKKTAEKSHLRILDHSGGQEGWAHALDCSQSGATTPSRGGPTLSISPLHQVHQQRAEPSLSYRV